MIALARRQWSVADYAQMLDVGILSEDDHVELIAGEIVEMSPMGPRHAACVDRLNRLLSRLVLESATVRVQSPIHLDDYSEPEPDLALLRPRDDFYAEGHPTPDDVLLLIEVADLSLDYDRDIKIPLYAHAMIGEVWLIDLQHTMIERYTVPLGHLYARRDIIMGGQSFTSDSIPGIQIDAASILP